MHQVGHTPPFLVSAGGICLSFLKRSLYLDLLFHSIHGVPYRWLRFMSIVFHTKVFHLTFKLASWRRIPFALHLIMASTKLVTFGWYVMYKLWTRTEQLLNRTSRIRSLLLVTSFGQRQLLFKRQFFFRFQLAMKFYTYVYKI